VYPFEIYSDARIAHLYATFELLIEFHQQHGYENFVIDYVFESSASLRDLLERLQVLDPAVHAYWLTCEKEEQAKRMRGRNRENLDWELRRFAELQEIQKQASEVGSLGEEVDTTHLSVSEIAEAVWTDIHSEALCGPRLCG